MWAAAADEVVEAGRGAASVVADAAPWDLGWVVDERADEGSGGDVRGVCEGRGAGVGAIADAVRRLCGVAEGMAGGGSVGGADEVLAGAVAGGGRVRGAGGAWARGGAELRLREQGTRVGERGKCVAAGD